MNAYVIYVIWTVSKFIYSYSKIKDMTDNMFEYGVCCRGNVQLLYTSTVNIAPLL